jgi:hypothetical protein
MNKMFSWVVPSLIGGVLLAGTAFAAEGILYKAQVAGTNYCHLKFPAIREDTLHWTRPVLKDSRTGDIIDFYGPCDYDPTGKDRVWKQKHQESQRSGKAND